MEAAPQASPTDYLIGDVTIDLVRREVRRGETVIGLGKLSYKLLVALAELAPKVVSPDELVDRVWDGRFVNPPTVKQRIALLRQALGDDAENPRYVKVVRGHGYAIVPTVTPVYEEPPSRSRQPTLWIAAAAVIAMLAAFVLTREPPVPTDQRPVVAVLPFENLISDPDYSFFATGLHEEVLGRLSRIRGLQVISRNSVMPFAGSGTAVTDIAREFDADAVLTGTVDYRDDRVRIALRLVSPEDGVQAWSNTYERDFADIFEIQKDIAMSVAGSLGIQLGVSETDAFPGAGTTELEAYKAYLAGLDMIRRPHGEDRASLFFEQAVEIDPGYAAAWTQLGLATVVRSYNSPPERAQQILAEALPQLLTATELDPRSPMAAAMLGFVRYSQFDWIDAERDFNRAIDLGPNRFSLTQHGSMLVRSGRITAAESEFDAANAIERSAVEAARLRRHVSVVQQKYDEARELVAMEAIAPRRQRLLLNIALSEGKPEVIKEAIAVIASTQGEAGPFYSGMLREFDSPDSALDLVRTAYADSSFEWPVKPFDIALFAAYFGDPELALEAVSEDVRLTTVRIWILWYPVMSEVRQLAGFKDLVVDLNLAAYWRAFDWPDNCAPLGQDDFRCW